MLIPGYNVHDSPNPNPNPNPNPKAHDDLICGCFTVQMQDIMSPDCKGVGDLGFVSVYICSKLARAVWDVDCQSNQEGIFKTVSVSLKAPWNYQGLERNIRKSLMLPSRRLNFQLHLHLYYFVPSPSRPEGGFYQQFNGNHQVDKPISYPL